MNLGLIVIAWVGWVCLHGVDPRVPQPNHFWMSVAFMAAASTSYTIKVGED